MKKLGFLTFFIVTFALFSCSNNEEATETTNDLNTKSNSTTRYTPNDFEIFGINHNLGLEHFYDNFKNSNVSTPLGYKQLCISDTKAFAQSFINNINKNEDPTFAMELTENYEIEKIDISINFYDNIEHSNEISSEARIYLDELHHLLFNINDEGTIEEIKDNIKVLETRAYNDSNINNKDLTFIYVSTSIARHSLEYWDADYDKWADVFENNGFFDGQQLRPGYTTLGAGKKTLKAVGAIVGGDVIGGAANAAATWALNVFIPPPGGQAAYGAAILGGAIRGSVTAAGGAILASVFDLW